MLFIHAVQKISQTDLTIIHMVLGHPGRPVIPYPL